MIELYYNDVPLHLLGQCKVLEESSASTPDSAPQRWLMTLRVAIDFTESNYRDNRLLFEQARAALSVQEGVLKWSETEFGEATDWINQTATVHGHDFPEDANAWGTHRQQIQITFQYERAIDQAHLITATFHATGSSGGPLTLGNVFTWKERYRSTRFNEMRSQRKFSGGIVSATGRFYGDPNQTLAQRRAALLELKAQWMDEVNGADGALAYGDSFDETVRVEEFECDVDQACDFIAWSLSATYTRFPDEDNYAVAEFKVTPRDNDESGETELALSGKIGAPDAATARAKLALVRTTVLAANGFTAAQRLSAERDEDNVSVRPPMNESTANTDGEAFIELTFNEVYRKKKSDVLSWSLRATDANDVRIGLTRTSYIGSVTVSGASPAAAYATAKAKAQELGANKYQMLLGSTLTAEYRRIGSTASGNEEFVRLEFSYEYQRKDADRVYLEMTAELSSDTFARSMEAVSGFVVAATEAAARTAYAQKVKAIYGSLLLINERTGLARHKIAKAVGVALESGESLDSDQSYVTQDQRLEFSFSVHRAKGSGETGLRYGIDVTSNFISREKVTAVSGSVFAATKAAAEAFLDSYFVFNATTGKYHWGSLSGQVLGKRVENRRMEAHEVGPRADGQLPRVDAFLEFTFSESFKDQVSSTATIFACDVAEEIQFSGTRWVAQAVVDGPDVMQNTGTQGGSRTVRGSVTALTETAAAAWMRKQYRLPFPAWNSAAPGTRYRQPPSVTTVFKFVELTDGVGRAGDYGGSVGPLSSDAVNLNAVEMGFSFTEILPDYGFVE